MITPPFKLSSIRPQQSNHTLQLPSSTRQQLHALRQQLTLIPDTFQIFKELTIASVKQWMGRISSLVYRQAKQKMMLESELQKSRQVQHSMRCEVIQLKQMINEAMSGYAKELEYKNTEINRLREIIQKSSINVQKLSKEVSEKVEEDLEIIQEQSEQTTFSSANTLRESKDEERICQQVEKSVYQQQHSPILESKLSPQSPHSEILQTSEKTNKKTKSFIDNFRKTIEQSQQKPEQNIRPVTYEHSLVMQKQNLIESHQSLSVQHVKIQKQPAFQQPLRQLSNFAIPHQTSIYVNPPVSFVPDAAYTRPKITFNLEQNRDISSISSSSDLTRGSEEHNSQILIAKKCQTPCNSHSIFKKKDRQHSRIMTEPSPQRIRPSHNYFSNKPAQASSNFRKSAERPHSHEQSKSIKTSVSKQKIKVTCKMVQEMNPPRRSTQNNKAIVYLGGKSLFRKFLIELKQAFKKYVPSVGINQDEVKYEGQRRNKMRWGRGRLFYRNGMVYEGEFRQNLRHGRGSLYLNGISIYEGQWRMDRIEGEGYLKSMKYMSKQCPSIFNQASYCGNLQDNRLHGIGTIFLNPKQKVVTKFNCGVPTGELTYYNLHEIEFGVWPSQ